MCFYLPSWPGAQAGQGWAHCVTIRGGSGGLFETLKATKGLMVDLGGAIDEPCGGRIPFPPPTGCSGRTRQLTSALPEAMALGMPSPHLCHWPSVSSPMSPYCQTPETLVSKALCPCPLPATGGPARFTAGTAGAPQMGRASLRFATHPNLQTLTQLPLQPVTAGPSTHPHLATLPGQSPVGTHRLTVT